MEVPWGALVALTTYIVGSTLGFVWWMATQTVKLEFAISSLETIKATLNVAEANYAKKLEVAERFAVLDRVIDKQWTEIEKLRDKNNSHNTE